MIAGLASTFGGCGVFDELLDVQAPSQVEAGDLTKPGAASLLVNSAVSDFVCALSIQVMAGGLIGDEFDDANLSVQDDDLDRRTITSNYAIDFNCNTPGTTIILAPYRALSTARYQADNVLELLEGWTDQEVANRGTLTATAAAYAGYATLLIGESWCSAAFDLGSEQTKTQVFERALTRFDRAIAAAQGNSQLLNLARVGRARTLLNLGRPQDAATTAAPVPAAFRLDAPYSSVAPRTENNVFVRNNRSGIFTVGPMYREFSYEGVPDPRVPVVRSTAQAVNPAVPLWVQNKYATAATSIPLARWEEAQLIIAEAQGGQAAVDIINALHTARGLPLFSSSDSETIKQQIIYERRAEFFLESHHVGDWIRYGLPLTPPAGSPFIYGGTYGNQRCFPLPDVERLNNPNLSVR